MTKEDLLYEGKAKKIYRTEDENLVYIHYKDDASAFNGVKRAQISNKGILNNEITRVIFEKLSQAGVENHFIRVIDERTQLCQKVDIIPLEFIVRNLIAGSMAKRLQIKEGTKPKNTIFEICLKNDDLGDPLINDHHAVAMGICTYDELDLMYKETAKINHVLSDMFLKDNIILVDFKIEFGKNNIGAIILADEISPDTCRLWDKDTLEKLDKDRFRRDLGNIEEAYIEVLERIK